VKSDECYIVEGYTDVISLHQAGVENVVSSSGTSLTTGQIQLLRRLTTNITILYDGDPAGIKASFRGIDMILSEGMNVKVVLFPNGEDPDSFARKNATADLIEFLKSARQDFISFKTSILQEESGKDPVKRASLIREIVSSIALIPDGIVRSVYVQQCSQQLDVPEPTLYFELNKIRREYLKKKLTAEERSYATEQPEKPDAGDQNQPPIADVHAEEKEVIRLMLNYGESVIQVPIYTESEVPEEQSIRLADFVIQDLMDDEVVFEDEKFGRVFMEMTEMNGRHELEKIQNYFLHHADEEIRNLAIDLVTPRYQMSENWAKKFNIHTETEDMILSSSINRAIYSLKLKVVKKTVRELQMKLKDATDPAEVEVLMKKKRDNDQIQSLIARELSRVIVH
jgi:DNA primase